MILKIVFLIIILVALYQLVHYEEGFQDVETSTKASKTSKEKENTDKCSGCEKTLVCPQANCPDMSKFVLKSSIPPCPPKQDLSKYVLRSSVPPMPDMDKYVLKSSVPACPACPACPEPEYTKNNCLLKCSPHFPRSTYIVKPITIKPFKKIVVQQDKTNSESESSNNTSVDKIKDFYTKSPSDSHYFSGNHYAKVGYNSAGLI